MKTNWPAFRCGFLILSSAVMGASPLLAQTQEPAGATATSAVISSVAITQAPQRASVRVDGAGRLDVRASRMQNPDRLVLDFAGAMPQISLRLMRKPCRRPRPLRNSPQNCLRQGRAWMRHRPYRFICATRLR